MLLRRQSGEPADGQTRLKVVQRYVSHTSQLVVDAMLKVALLPGRKPEESKDKEEWTLNRQTAWHHTEHLP